MTITRTDLINRFIGVRTKGVTLNWGQFASAIAGLTVDQRNQLLLAINNEDKEALCSIVLSVAKTVKTQLATTDVNTLIAGNTLTIDQILTLVE